MMRKILLGCILAAVALILLLSHFQLPGSLVFTAGGGVPLATYLLISVFSTL
jgi:hypothetical protein